MKDFNDNTLEILTEWDNNPREMWVWDNGESFPQKKKVIFIDKSCIYPVVTRDEETTACFQCCADIIPEPEKKFRPYKDNHELISDYLLRFVSLDAIRPSIWLRRVDPDTKEIREFCIDMFVYNHECDDPEIDKRRYDGVVALGCLCEMDSIAQDYTYLDGSYVGIEE